MPVLIRIHSRMIIPVRSLCSPVLIFATHGAYIELYSVAISCKVVSEHRPQLCFLIAALTAV